MEQVDPWVELDKALDTLAYAHGALFGLGARQKVLSEVGASIHRLTKVIQDHDLEQLRDNDMGKDPGKPSITGA